MKVYSIYSFVLSSFCCHDICVFIHIVLCISSSFFLWLSNALLYENSTICLSILLWWMFALGCFQFMAIINKAAMNTQVQVCIFYFSWVNAYELYGWVIGELYVLILFKTCQICFTVIVQFYAPITNYDISSCSSSSPASGVMSPLNVSHSGGCDW